LLTAAEKGFLMTTPVQKLHRLGQSLWYDNIQRRMLEDGTLADMIRAW
jgi:hypothetical protein